MKTQNLKSIDGIVGVKWFAQNLWYIFIRKQKSEKNIYAFAINTTDVIKENKIVEKIALSLS